MVNVLCFAQSQDWLSNLEIGTQFPDSEIEQILRLHGIYTTRQQCSNPDNSPNFSPVQLYHDILVVNRLATATSIPANFQSMLLMQPSHTHNYIFKIWSQCPSQGSELDTLLTNDIFAATGELSFNIVYMKFWRPCRQKWALWVRCKISSQIERQLFTSTKSAWWHHRYPPQ